MKEDEKISKRGGRVEKDRDKEIREKKNWRTRNVRKRDKK